VHIIGAIETLTTHPKMLIGICIFKGWCSTRKGKCKTAGFSKSREKAAKFRQGRTSTIGEALGADFD